MGSTALDGTTTGYHVEAPGVIVISSDLLLGNSWAKDFGNIKADTIDIKNIKEINYFELFLTNNTIRDLFQRLINIKIFGLNLFTIGL